MALITIVIMVLIFYLVIFSWLSLVSLLILFHLLSRSTTFSTVSSISLLWIFCIISITIISYSKWFNLLLTKTDKFKTCASQVAIFIILICIIFPIFFNRFIYFSITKLIFHFYRNCKLFWIIWSIVDAKLTNLRRVQVLLLSPLFWLYWISTIFSTIWSIFPL